MTDLDQNRLVAKEVALGQVREILQPNNFIQPTIAPFREVQSDDVIFQYITPEVDGLAPARAEDAEAELAQKDDTVGYGRASLIDWAIKDHYSASDVTRYREYLRLAELAGTGNFPLTISSMTEDWAAKLARDTRIRRRKLDNRVEWLAAKGAFDGVVTYNDGNIQFSVDYGRPVGQTAQAPTNGLWSLDTSDPIGDIYTMNEDVMFPTHGVRLTRAYTSLKVMRNIWNSTKFAARSGLAGATGSVPIDPRYLIDGWSWEAAAAVVARQTGVQFFPYEGFYRTRALGSTTTVVNHFVDERDILFLPPEEVVNEISDLGFGVTMTSPHPEGNWTSGFYEWEKDTGPDPWGYDIGTGIKAFPVFPHLEFSYTMRVLA